MLDAVREVVLQWHIFTSSLSAGAMPAFRSLDARIGVPLISALLLGILGAAAPCQLTQSVGMLAFLSQRGEGRPAGTVSSPRWQERRSSTRCWACSQWFLEPAWLRCQFRFLSQSGRSLAP